MYKLVIFILASSSTVSACVKENTPTNAVTNPADSSMAMSGFGGMCDNGPYGSVNGKAKIYFQNNQYILALENFTSSNSPDLHVYFSKDAQPVNYIDLGKLQSVSGNQQYSNTGNINFSEYKYALIHCQQFNHLFGNAELK